jgi:hypothetical protein
MLLSIIGLNWRSPIKISIPNRPIIKITTEPITMVNQMGGGATGCKMAGGSMLTTTSWLSTITEVVAPVRGAGSKAVVTSAPYYLGSCAARCAKSAGAFAWNVSAAAFDSVGPCAYSFAMFHGISNGECWLMPRAFTVPS